MMREAEDEDEDFYYAYLDRKGWEGSEKYKGGNGEEEHLWGKDAFFGNFFFF
jgi:hypothetical protein